jgi:4-hydroxy-L-threonine phosphate dehydrogenase PdxA
MIGLPFVRTSPDHEIAFDIAGQNAGGYFVGSGVGE